ncbi:MAG: hypothetical protein ACTHM7_08425 [Ginsengibacter sp.]
MCALPHFVESTKVTSHLLAVHKYNLKNDLTEHANPQRPSYALGREGGLLLCTWPKGGKLSYPLYTAMKSGQELNTRWHRT